MDHIYKMASRKMRPSSQFFLSKVQLLSKIYIICFLVSGCAYIGNQTNLTTHTEYSYYPNGQIEYAAEYVNGKLDGTSRFWHEDGTLISESEYSNGKPHGIWKKYFSNKTIMHETSYFHGQKHGIEKWYYENGQIKSEQTFQFDIPIDDQIRFYPDGSIIY